MHDLLHYRKPGLYSSIRQWINENHEALLFCLMIFILVFGGARCS